MTKMLEDGIIKRQSQNKHINRKDINSICSAASDSDSSLKSESKWKSFKDSFKRHEIIEIDGSHSKEENARLLIASVPLKRSLKGRHLQMIAIGATIGTGLLVESGYALKMGGPAGILFSSVIISSMLFAMLNALGELATTLPVAGSFTILFDRFIDSSWGFAVSWSYVIRWLTILPTSLVAAAMSIHYWTHGMDVNSVAWIAPSYVVIGLINLFGVRVFGETEFIFSVIKLTSITGFIICGITLICGGTTVHKEGYIGAKYWHDPGAFSNGFKGVCYVFITSVFSFNGTELVGLAAAESKNPRKVLPKATKKIFWTIFLIYFVSLLIVGFLVPYNDPHLSRTVDESDNITTSPFVIALSNAGVKSFPTIMNVVVIVSVTSISNAAVFASSRILAAMATIGIAPQFLSYIDRKGRPLFGILVTMVLGLLCLLAASDKEWQIFHWLMAVSSLSSIFVWGSIAATHIRFRYTLDYQGRGVDELSYESMTGIWGSYYVIFISIIVIITQFWISLFPIGLKPDALKFFKGYLSVIIILILYFGHKLWTRNWRWYIPIEEIDIDTGRREHDIDLYKQEIAEHKQRLRSKPFFIRWYDFWC